MGSQAIPGEERLWERLARLSDKALEESIPSYIQPELYHYTTVEGLHGIIESKTLRATSAYHLNDSSEIEYGCRLIVEVCDEWAKANEKNASLPLFIIRTLRRILLNSESRISRYMGVYVSCFCQGGNLLSQWRTYGQAGGYSIGMLSAELEMGMRATGIFETRLLRVTYDERKQREGIHSTLRSFIDEVESAGIEIPADSQALMNLLTPLLLVLQELLLDRIVAYKHPAFQEEQEWRVIARPRIVDLRGERAQESPPADTHTKPQPRDPDVKYRTSKGVLVPFLELKPVSGQLLPIHSVRFGPSLDKFRTEYALKGFLARHGYHGIKVFGCDTPVLL